MSPISSMSVSKLSRQLVRRQSSSLWLSTRTWRPTSGRCLRPPSPFPSTPGTQRTRAPRVTGLVLSAGPKMNSQEFLLTLHIDQGKVVGGTQQEQRHHPQREVEPHQAPWQAQTRLNRQRRKSVEVPETQPILRLQLCKRTS